MKFTIDGDTWRCGGNGNNSIGLGDTCLLNRDGYMCCLGQICVQLGLAENDIFGEPTPRDATDPRARLHSGFLKPNGDNSYLSTRAIAINDNSFIDNATRIKLLTQHFEKYGHELEFINTLGVKDEK